MTFSSCTYRYHLLRSLAMPERVVVGDRPALSVNDDEGPVHVVTVDRDKEQILLHEVYAHLFHRSIDILFVILRLSREQGRGGRATMAIAQCQSTYGGGVTQGGNVNNGG